MVFATSRNNLRTASEVKRGAGSGLVPRGRVRAWAGRVAHLLCQLAEFGLGNRQFERVQLLVQEADLLAIPEPERLQPGSSRVDLGGARAQQRLELDEPCSRGSPDGHRHVRRARAWSRQKMIANGSGASSARRQASACLRSRSIRRDRVGSIGSDGTTSFTISARLLRTERIVERCARETRGSVKVLRPELEDRPRVHSRLPTVARGLRGRGVPSHGCTARLLGCIGHEREHDDRSCIPGRVTGIGAAACRRPGDGQHPMRWRSGEPRGADSRAARLRAARDAAAGLAFLGPRATGPILSATLQAPDSLAVL